MLTSDDLDTVSDPDRPCAPHPLAGGGATQAPPPRAAGEPRILLLAAHTPPPEWSGTSSRTGSASRSIPARSGPGPARSGAGPDRACPDPCSSPAASSAPDDRWIDLAVGPYTVVELLVRRFGELVPVQEIEAVYLGRGQSN